MDYDVGRGNKAVNVIARTHNTADSGDYYDKYQEIAAMEPDPIFHGEQSKNQQRHAQTKEKVP